MRNLKLTYSLKSKVKDKNRKTKTLLICVQSIEYEKWGKYS